MGQSRPLSFSGRHQATAEQSLLDPDNSLAAHEDLAAMAMLSTQPPAPCNVTKLLLPSESATQLDPSLLSQAAADNENTIYHIMTTDNEAQQVVSLL